jgi:hypothetical protein
VPGETRFDAILSQTEFLHEDTYRISASVDNYIIYDPLLETDQRHALEYQKEAMQKAASLTPIRMPCGGHTPTVLLSECGMLSEFLLQLIEGQFCAPRFRTAFRKMRTSSPQYWRELADRLQERGHGETAKRIAKLTRDREGRHLWRSPVPATTP